MAQSRAFDEVCGVFFIILIIIVYLYVVFVMLFFGEGVVILFNHVFCVLFVRLYIRVCEAEKKLILVSSCFPEGLRLLIEFRRIWQGFTRADLGPLVVRIGLCGTSSHPPGEGWFLLGM